MKYLLSAAVVTAAVLGLLVSVLRSNPATQSVEPARLLSPGPSLGRPCKVYLRGDVLGAAIPQQLPPKEIWRFEVGTLGVISDQWLMIQQAGREVWIPRTSVLLVEADR